MSNILDKFGRDALQEYIFDCDLIKPIDKALAYNEALAAIKYYRGDSSVRAQLSGVLDLEEYWYRALKAGTVDYSVYSHDYYFVDLWACWVVYSREYIRMMTKRREIFGNEIASVADIGNGFGYTTAALKQMFPDAEVFGTNLNRTAQFKIASKNGKKYGFSMLASFEPMPPVDLLFASEYFEHIFAPVDHLQGLLEGMTPKMLVIANSFGAESIGHFPEYEIDGQMVSNKKVGRIFNKTLRDNGYQQVKTGFWNNRPTVWRLS